MQDNNIQSYQRLNIDRERQIQKRLYPSFPIKNKYDVILIDPPWKYEKNTQKVNIPSYNVLSYNELTYLPIRTVSKENCVLLLWTTAPMMEKALQLIKSFGFRYVTVFQNWIKTQNGKYAKIKSAYSNASSEFLLWSEKGRTNDLKTPDTVEQVITSEIMGHSQKPYELLYKNLILRLHLNKLKCLEVFARNQQLKYFDIYGDEIEQRFKTYDVSNQVTLQEQNDRVQEILNKVQCNGFENKMQTILEKYKYAFALSKQELGKTPIAKHHIRIQQQAVPIRHNPYRCSPKELEFLQKEVTMLEGLKCIERCEATWVMPVIMVKKKDTTDLRMCIDYRSLNKNMIVENYPIPRIDDILTTLGKGRYFSKLDLKSGFWQVEIDKESQQYTGFITPFGTFRWKRMPFGLKNAPATFQRIIEQALRPLLNKICIVYIDDIVIFSETKEQHMKDIIEVLEHLSRADLRIGADKCEFFQNHIDILGHHLSNGQVQPQQSKIKAIIDIKPPENRSQVRSFVGMCSYYRSFIKDFTIKCGPLLKLTQQKVDFIWSEECQKSFEIMKQELCIAPLLQTPNPQGTYILQTDFSEKGLGAVLNQILPNEDTPRVIEYASRSLRGAEVNYPAYEGEVLAVHWALEKFRHYLHGVNFILFTDNKALQQVFESQTRSKKIIRWLMDMQEYTFTTQHRPGKDNANADALSRLFTIPDDINIRVNLGQESLSVQTYQSMYQGNRMDELDDVQINAQMLSEGVGDVHCKICNLPHTREPMIICERCGNGFHTISCLKPALSQIPKIAWYCQECLTLNAKQKFKDITMDFDCLDYMMQKTDLSQFDEARQHSIATRASHYKIMHNRIYYIKGPHPTLVPTIAERKLLVKEQHRVLVHPSPQQLIQILRQNFYWANMEYLVEQVTYDCQVCQARKVNNLPLNTYTPTNKGHAPFHTISMDLAPELKKTTKLNRHLLIIVDNFSKFTLLYPLKDKSSQTLAETVFNKFVCTYGTPKCIRVDQGTEFKGDVQDLAERWGIEIARATTYHPQSNGLAERMIQVVKRSLLAAVNDMEIDLDWDDACYLVQMSINAAQSRATGLSPYNVVFGRMMSVPQAIVYDIPLEDFQEPSKMEMIQYQKQFQGHIKKCHKILKQNRQKADTQNKLKYEKENILKKQHSFLPNQLVFIKRSNASRWALPNIGPFIFMRYTSNKKDVALVQNPATQNVTRQSVANLSPWKIIEGHKLEET